MTVLRTAVANAALGCLVLVLLDGMQTLQENV